MDARRARGDGRQYDVGGRHREVVCVMFADTEEVEAHVLRQHSLLDDVADRLRVGHRSTLLAVVISERVQAEDEGELVYGFLCTAVRRERSAHLSRLLCVGRVLHREWGGHAAIAPSACSNSSRLKGRPKTGPSGSSARPERRLPIRTGSNPSRSTNLTTRSTAAGSSPAMPSARRSGSPAGRLSSSIWW